MPKIWSTYVPPAVVSAGEVPAFSAERFGGGLLTAELMFVQVMKKAHVARQRLLRLGIFKEVEVLIDTSEGTGRGGGGAGALGCD